MSRIDVSAVVGQRICAAVATGSAGLHAVLLGHSRNVAMGVLMAAMIVACLYCACELWRAGTVRAWLVVALMNLAMIALHLPAPAHHHSAAAGSSTQSAAMTVATLLAFTEVLAAAAVLYVRTRGRVVEISGVSDGPP